VPLGSRELAEAVAAHVEAQVARGRLLEDVLAEISPNGGGASSILREQKASERFAAGFRVPGGPPTNVVIPRAWRGRRPFVARSSSA